MSVGYIFHTQAKRDPYVKLPPEDHEAGRCGRLNKARYGTRDAAPSWETKYIQFMTDIGFMKGQSTPFILFHPERNIRVAVHGDDFTVQAYESELDWFRRHISQIYEVKFRGRVGPEKKESTRIRILNRVIELAHKGIYEEADQRHAEIIVRDLGLHDSNSVVTPGEKRKLDVIELDVN